MYLYLKRTQARAVAERDERARRALAAQIRADRDAARSGWAPPSTRTGSARADLFQTAQAWGAAMPYADRIRALVRARRRDRDAQMRRTPPRCCTPTPWPATTGSAAKAMGPADAMREAAPLFATPRTRLRRAVYGPRPMLDAGTART